MLTLLFLLQRLLHHCFVMLMGHLKEVLERSKLYSVELRKNSESKTMSICFWEGGHLLDMELSSIPRDIPVVEGELNLVSQLQSARTSPQVILCGGCNADVLKSLDHDPDRQAGIQKLSCFEPIDIKKLMYEPSYSVLGGIGMFSLLQTLLPLICGILGGRWLESTNFLRIVRR